jgi:squalene-associated FAD-dependent desaturase
MCLAREARSEITMSEWLLQQGQSEAARERFWTVVLVSALSESLERISVAAARKVFVDGFLASRDAYVVEVPRVPLDELYGRTAEWLEQRGATIHRSTTVKGLDVQGPKVVGLRMADGQRLPCDVVVVAVPWRRLPDVLSTTSEDVLSPLRGSATLEASPISSLHLWFDRSLSPLSHAVLVGRLSQWVFHHETTRKDSQAQESYYQVVISASRDLLHRDRNEVRDEVLADLAAIWPETARANLLRWRLVTQHEAVFSPLPGIASKRLPQTTALENLFLAGDWTQTGWPATMESAVRSGYLAAEKVLESLGRPQEVVCPEKRCWIVRRWLRKSPLESE